jgi:hypothetical protein
MHQGRALNLGWTPGDNICGQPSLEQSVHSNNSKHPQPQGEQNKDALRQQHKRTRPLTPDKLRRRVAYLLWTAAMRCDA